MLNSEYFERLSQQVLLTLLQGGSAEIPAEAIAERVIDITHAYFRALRDAQENERVMDLMAPPKDRLTHEEVALLQAGKVISAIKSVRTRRGCSLREGKAFVEKECARLGIAWPTYRE